MPRLQAKCSSQILKRRYVQALTQGLSNEIQLFQLIPTSDRSDNPTD